MRALLTKYGSRGDVKPLEGLAGQVCAPPHQEFAELLAGVGVPLVPIGQPVRPPVTKATTPSADLPPRAAAEECDAPVATDVMPTGGLR
jgi:vancomycin aglycone glucosyltransferase